MKMFACLMIIALLGCGNRNRAIKVDMELLRTNLKIHQKHIINLAVAQEAVELRVIRLEDLQSENDLYVVGTWEEDRECLSNIAEKRLYNAYRWPEIFELNKDKITDPHLIYPNQELRLPKI